MIDQSDLESAVPDLEALLVEMIGSVLGEQAENSWEPLPEAVTLALSRLAIYNPADGSYLGVEVRAESGLVTTLAATLLGVPDPAPDDMLDVIAELGNIAAGNVKSLLCHNGNLSLPMDKLSVEHELNPPGTVRAGASLWGSVVELVVMPMTSAEPGTRWPPGSAPEESAQAQHV
jgi:hypothetical protein